MKKRMIACVSVLSVLIGMCGCHSHEFSDATCTQPMKCISCGETQGDTLPHTYMEATCSNPKTCSVCGAVDGVAKGHTVSYGKCGNCDEFVNSQVLYDIIEISDKADADYFFDSDKVVTAVTNNDMYTLYSYGYTIAQEDLDYQRAMIPAHILAGEYPELKTLRELLDKIIYYNVTAPLDTSLSAISNFYDSSTNFTNLRYDFKVELLRLKNEMDLQMNS